MPPSGQSQRPFSPDHRLVSTLPVHRCADLGEMISFLSRVIATLATSATRPSNVLRSPRQGEWMIIYSQTPENLSALALDRTGPNAWC